METLTEQKLKTLLLVLEKDSLAKRVARLFAICKPEKGFAPIGGGFSFDSERLGKLDEQRHRIVHGEGYQNAEAVASADLWFLVQSGLFLWAMVNKTYDVKLNPLYAIGVELPSGGEASSPSRE